MGSASDPTSTDTRPPVAVGTSSSSALAFLVHSQDTVQNNLPPCVDNKSLARQKRRRTSPEDQRILEAEYSKNPKPDKAARLDIVERVALGEKEVQIWFQNRRQNSRRKSRPLEPHEVLTHLRSSSQYSTGSQAADDPELSDDGKIDGEEAAQPSPAISDMIEPSGTLDAQITAGRVSSLGPDSAAQGTVGNAVHATNVIEDSQIDSTVQTISQSTQIESQETRPTTQGSPQPSPSLIAVGDGEIHSGYIANRRSASFLLSQEEPASGQKPVTKPTRKRTLGRVSSYLRLSMTEDGHAQVIDRAMKSPSPSKLAELGPRSGNLRRSYSAAGLNGRPRDADEDAVGRKVQRTSTIGRSRDSRAWEFWCDSDARNSLVNKADSEVSGSAADAIGHIVASNKALRANQSRRNLPLGPINFDHMNSHGQGKVSRPPLSRSSTSYGRLQSRTATLGGEKSMQPKKSSKGSDEFEILATESDKENWEPGDDNVSNNLQTVGHSVPSKREILGENTKVLSQSSSLGAMMDKERRKIQKQSLQRRPSEIDDEVARLMGQRESSNSVPASTSSGEDLDCVQSLLSLSQGNWK